MNEEKTIKINEKEYKVGIPHVYKLNDLEMHLIENELKEWNLYYWYRYYNFSGFFAYEVKEVSREEKRYRNNGLIIVLNRIKEGKNDRREMSIFEVEKYPSLVHFGSIRSCLFDFFYEFYSLGDTETFDTFFLKLFTKYSTENSKNQEINLSEQVKKFWFFQNRNQYRISLSTEKFNLYLEGQMRGLFVPALFEVRKLG